VDQQPDQDDVTVALVVTGRVQGVGFRWWSRGLARDAGVSGFIWNHPDGSVRLLLKGSRGAVSKVRRGVEGGPPAARVDRVVEVATSVTVDIDDVRIGAPTGGG